MTTAIERLQAQSDRANVNAWLDHINETDQVCREEVLENCKADKECRAYFVKRFKEDCK